MKKRGRKSGYKVLNHPPQFSAETKERIKQANLGKVPWNKGNKNPDLSEKQKGINNPNWKGGTSLIPYVKKGRVYTKEIRKQIGDKSRGDKHYNWKGGITPLQEKVRKSFEYKLWRKAVFERDNYTCIWCGVRSGNGKHIELNADHIKPFALFPELRFAIDNGRTLCRECHQTTETWGRPKKCIYDIKIMR